MLKGIAGRHDFEKTKILRVLECVCVYVCVHVCVKALE